MLVFLIYETSVSIKNSLAALHTTLLTRPVPELYKYNRGRWLIDDKLHQDARYLSFDFEALCAVVLESCPGATRITSLEKKEGNNARVFIFSLDHGKKAVAKLATSVAGPKQLTTNSEVATMKYSMFEPCHKLEMGMTHY